MALVSICFIIISTVVLTLNTLPYFQVTMVTTLITFRKQKRVLITSYSELNSSCNLCRVQRGVTFDAYLSVYYSLKIALDTYFIYQFITPLRLPLIHNLLISLLLPRDLLYLLASNPTPWEAVVCIVVHETTK